MTRGARVATVVRVDPMRVELTVPEQSVSLISVGQPVRITVDAYPGETFTARIRFVSPSLRPDQRALTVEAIAPNPDGRLKPGLFATASIQQPPSAPALLVPSTAVETVSGTSRVYVVKGDTVEERIVTTGETVGPQVEITSGVTAKGDRRRRAEGKARRRRPRPRALTPIAPRVLQTAGSQALQLLAGNPDSFRETSYAVAGSSISVKRPVFASVLILSLTVVGAFAFTQLGLDRFPKVDFPTVVVTTRLPGAAPEEVETEITDKIEEAVNTISAIDELRSNSSEGVSQVIISFLLEKDADIAAQEVRDRVNRVLPLLPKTIQQPTVEKFDPDSAPVLTLAVSANKPVRDITEYADKTLRRQLESVNGVGQVVVAGRPRRGRSTSRSTPRACARTTSP